MYEFCQSNQFHMGKFQIWSFPIPHILIWHVKLYVKSSRWLTKIWLDSDFWPPLYMLWNYAAHWRPAGYRAICYNSYFERLLSRKIAFYAQKTTAYYGLYWNKYYQRKLRFKALEISIRYVCDPTPKASLFFTRRPTDRKQTNWLLNKLCTKNELVKS